MSKKTKAVTINLTYRHLLIMFIAIQLFWISFSVISHYLILGVWEWSVVWDFLEVTWSSNLMLMLVLFSEKTKKSVLPMTYQKKVR